MNRISIGSDNGLSPIWHQAIISTNARLLAVGPSVTKLRWNFNQNTFHSQNCIWKHRLRNGGHFVQGEMSWILKGSDTPKNCGLESKFLLLWNVYTLPLPYSILTTCHSVVVLCQGGWSNTSPAMKYLAPLGPNYSAGCFHSILLL